MRFSVLATEYEQGSWGNDRMYFTYINVYEHVGSSEHLGSLMRQTAQKHFSLTDPPSIEHSWRPRINQGGKRRRGSIKHIYRAKGTYGRGISILLHACHRLRLTCPLLISTSLLISAALAFATLCTDAGPLISRSKVMYSLAASLVPLSRR
jgi:hypothetical protein